MSSTTFQAPFIGPVTNTCVVPNEVVALDGMVKITSITQSDGSIGSYFTYNGTGLTVFPFSGVKYSFSDETHGWFLGGPSDVFVSFYDYEKITRAGETGTSLLGGDDFFLRFYFRFPPGSGGVPSEDSLNTNTIAFDCR